VVRLEFDQDVDIAVGAEVVAKHRPEQGEPPDSMSAAKVSDLLVRDLDARPASTSSRGITLRGAPWPQLYPIVDGTGTFCSSRSAYVGGPRQMAAICRRSSPGCVFRL